MNTLEDILKKHQSGFARIVPFDLSSENVVIMDFTAANRSLQQVDIDDKNSFTNYVFDMLKHHGSDVGIGGYGEDRIIYRRSEVFTREEVRSIHLGIDIWAAAGTPVFAPLEGTVHSFKNNESHGDYGPTIILEHHLEGHTFYTLYGHLSSDSLNNLQRGQIFKPGAQIARLGEYHENVHWPPHLHFQVIKSMGEHYGDYPGVASIQKSKDYLDLCPNPNLILGTPLLP